MPPHTAIYRRADVPAPLMASIDEWAHRIFIEADPSSKQIEWTGGEWLVIVCEGEQWVSSLELLERTITVGGRPVRVGGVGGVMTHPDRRRRGYASMAMRQAAAFMRDAMKVPFGFLVCGASRIPFYSALGWQVVEGPCTFEQSTGRMAFPTDTVLMALACRDDPWPGGPIDLCGPPW